jgi:V8-like Glu-specific endopeptidase
MELSELVIKVECGTKSGTAFFISKNRALTAYHIVIGAKDNEIICIDNSGKKIKAKLSNKVTEQYKKLDIALLELEEEVTFAYEFSFTNYEEIKSGTNWVSRGFPSAKEISGDNILYGDSNIVNQQLKCLRNNKIDIELEHSKKLSTYAGYSGSPLVINNSIAGIINQELLENGESKELTALSIKHFKELLIGECVEVKEKETSVCNPLRKVLSNGWFDRHIEKSVIDLGVRYTPEVNVKIDVTKKLDALLKNNDFSENARKKFHSYLVELNNLVAHFSSYSAFEPSSKEYSNQSMIVDVISIKKQDVQNIFEDFSCNVDLTLDLCLLKNKADFIQDEINKLVTLQLGNDSNQSSLDDEDNDSKNKSNEMDSTSQNNLNSATRASVSFRSFLDSPDIHTLLTNSPYLLLKGKAGIGKSHILADAVVSQNKKGIPSVLLLGQHFTTDKSPWSQIMEDLLRLDYSELDLLESLNEIGEEHNQRVLFSIDAINEGRGKFFWAEHLSSFVNDFIDYPWVSLVITVRDTYLPKLIPQDFYNVTKMKVVNHAGFSAHEHEAVIVFFNYYHINFPTTPFITTEFSNPLFLKLFCEGLYKRNLSQVPEGYRGISSVMNYFIDNIDMKLGRPQFYDYGDSRKVCRKIINGLIKYMQANEIGYVPYDEACDISNGIIERYTIKKGIIEDLVHEGLFSKNIYWLDNGEDEEGIYLAYEKLVDHFSAESLADDIITFENIGTIFTKNGKLNYLVEEDYRYQGVLEALSILLPEKYGKELFEVVDVNKREELTIINAFINSLTWRGAKTINKTSDEYVNDTVLQYVESFEAFLELMYTVAGNIGHPYNANRLHKFLAPMSLAERDSEWTTFLKHRHDSGSAIGRSLEWVFQSDMHKNISDDSKLLIAIATAWLCVSTNIELRNNATKALTILLVDRLSVGLELLKIFESIDDPYVYERILAALYGASLNTKGLENLRELAKYIVEVIFLKEEVYPNVLVRDYARNIVEFSLIRGQITLENPEIIRPPYNSTLPKRFPSNEKTDSYKFDWDSKDFKKIYGSQNRILSSMITEYGRGICSYGDFGRYTFQSALNLWNDLDPNPLSNYACKLVFEKFGYDVNIHGQFDKHAGEGDRFEVKVERIGKKYQWLALYEVIARLGDNSKINDWDGNEVGYYQGPWQNSLRNIDPTYIPESINNKELPLPVNNINYDDWGGKGSSWLISGNNLPDPKEMIVNDNFLSLEANYSWQPKEQLGIERENSERKNVWYQIRSYLVKDAEFENLKNWLEKQDFMGRWMPESNESYSVFSKEHYWSPAYKYKVAENDELRWQPINNNRYDRRDNDVVAEVLPTAEEHRWEDKDGTSFLAPRAEMFEGMNLSSSEIPSCWLDNNGILACFDPHVFGEAKSELLVNKQLLEKFLKDKGLKVIWTVLGEKQVLGSSKEANWIDMSGVYFLEKDSIEGGMTINLKEPGWKSKQGNEKINREVDFDEILKSLAENSE